MTIKHQQDPDVRPAKPTTNFRLQELAAATEDPCRRFLYECLVALRSFQDDGASPTTLTLAETACAPVLARELGAPASWAEETAQAWRKCSQLLADLLFLKSRHEESILVAKARVAVARARDDRLDEVESMHQMVHVFDIYDPRLGLQVAEDATMLARDTGDIRSLGDLYAHAGRLSLRLEPSKPSAALRSFESSVCYSVLAEDETTNASALVGLGLCLWLLGNHKDGRLAIDQGIARADALQADWIVGDEYARWASVLLECQKS